MQELAQADFVLRVHLDSYSNTLHTKHNGFCCDSQSICSSDCNNRFEFCLRPFIENDGCSLGEFQTTNISDDDTSFVVGENLDDNTTNPLVFRGTVWPVNITMSVCVRDR